MSEVTNSFKNWFKAIIIKPKTGVKNIWLSCKEIFKSNIFFHFFQDVRQNVLIHKYSYDKSVFSILCNK